MFAKKQTIGIALLAILVAAFFGSACFAGEDANVRAVGVVSTTKDADGTITAVQVAADTGTYNIVLDEKGLELGAMDGQKVDVTGILSEEDGQQWIQVTEFSVAE